MTLLSSYVWLLSRHASLIARKNFLVETLVVPNHKIPEIASFSTVSVGNLWLSCQPSKAEIPLLLESEVLKIKSTWYIFTSKKLLMLNISARKNLLWRRFWKIQSFSLVMLRDLPRVNLTLVHCSITAIYPTIPRKWPTSSKSNKSQCLAILLTTQRSFQILRLKHQPLLRTSHSHQPI